MDFSLAMIWLACNLLSIGVLAFYSMLEMACLSFNKIRLQYYVSNNNSTAIMLNKLLQRPSLLFGTTLIGVNIATFVGSECAREFHSALGLNPDWAPLSQVLIVIIFGELAPMFAARHYAENVAMLGVPLIYASAKIMSPLLWVLHKVTEGCQWLIGGKPEEGDIYLSQEEIQKIIDQDQDEGGGADDSEDLGAIAENIFAFKSKDTGSIMQKLEPGRMLPGSATVSQVRERMIQNKATYVLLYHNVMANIVGIATARDLVRASEHKKVREYAKTPWLITKGTKLMTVLKQFKRNQQSAAVVINEQGHAIGVLDFDDVLEEIFGASIQGKMARKPSTFIEKSLPAEMTIADFNRQFHVHLPLDPQATLGEVILKQLGRQPEKGESIYIEPYEFTVKEMSLLDIKTVLVQTRI